MTIQDETFSVDLTVLADAFYSYRTNFAADVELGQITITASIREGVGLQENVEIWLDSSAGADYDTLLWSGSFNGRTSFVWRPRYRLLLDSGSELRIIIHNRNRLGTIHGTTIANSVGVVAPLAPVITSSLTASGDVGLVFSSYQITATNSPTSFNATGLPAGLSINTGTGLITGTPTTAATVNVTISATNASGTDSDTLVITTNPLPAILADMAVYDAGAGGTMGGRAFSSFPSLLARMSAGDYSGSLTLAIRGAALGFNDGGAPEVQRRVFFYDQAGLDEYFDVSTGATSDLTWYEVNQETGDFFFVATDGTSYKGGALFSPTGTLPGFPAGSYVAEEDSSPGVAFAWPRVLTTVEMDQAIALYAS